MSDNSPSVLDKLGLGQLFGKEKKSEEEINREIEELQKRHEEEIKKYVELHKRWGNEEVAAFKHIYNTVTEKTDNEKVMLAYILVAELKLCERKIIMLERENKELRKQIPSE